MEENLELEERDNSVEKEGRALLFRVYVIAK